MRQAPPLPPPAAQAPAARVRAAPAACRPCRQAKHAQLMLVLVLLFAGTTVPPDGATSGRRHRPEAGVGTAWGPASAAASSHLPADARPFQQLSPFEAANVARECLLQFGAQQPDANPTKSPWAGHVLGNTSTPVLAGPLVPKAGSSLLRAMFGDVDRPQALTPAGAVIKDRQQLRREGTLSRGHGRFWFAIARDPLTQFVDAYMQASNGVAAQGDCKFERIRTPQWFCGLTPACRTTHFHSWLEAAASESLNVHTHRASQMHWMRSALQHGVDALLRIETLHDDWQAAAAYAEDVGSPDWKAAAEWLRAALPLVKAHVVNGHSNVVDDREGAPENACERWRKRVVRRKAVRLELVRASLQRKDALYEYYQVLQDNALQHLFGPGDSALNHTTPALKTLCRQLWLDYACLRYALPVQCQAAFLRAPPT